MSEASASFGSRNAFSSSCCARLPGVTLTLWLYPKSKDAAFFFSAFVLRCDASAKPSMSTSIKTSTTDVSCRRASLGSNSITSTRNESAATAR